jgi:CubicO group peptidase (beta-lactamase class C family)
VLSFLGANAGAGATVAVTRNGRLVWSKGYGWANRDERIRMQPWHRSRIGSVSKVITAIGLLQMLENENVGGLTAGGAGSLTTRLAQRVYGHPGTAFNSPNWPHVNGSTVLSDPERYWKAIRDGVQAVYPSTYEDDMARTIEWASQVELRHLLSHTSGLLHSGSADKAAAHYGVAVSELTYPDIHTWVLGAGVMSKLGGKNFACMGETPYDDEGVDEEAAAPNGTEPKYRVPPFLFEPATKDCYSNHGFGLTGHVIDERSGPGDANTYRAVIERKVLHPLGLTHVVQKNTDIGELDAWPHGSQHNPADLNPLGLPTGGWVATARDLARVMCGLDRGSNNLRLLRPDTVTAMEPDVAPEASGTQPLGWDYRSGTSLYKNGSTAGGKAAIAKFLPGEFDAAPNDEINVAMNLNGGSGAPNEAVLQRIAGKVAAADISADYDLFPPSHACVVDRSPDGLVQATASPTNPTPTTTRPGHVVATPGPRPTANPTRAPGITVTPTRISPPVPPVALIRQPTAGQHLAPRGVASIDFSGAAADAAGNRIAGTNLRWTAIRGTQRTVLCAGSGFGPSGSTSPTGGPGGISVVSDFTRF